MTAPHASPAHKLWIVGKHNRIQTEPNAQGGCTVIVGELAIGDAQDAKRIADCVNYVTVRGELKTAAVMAELYVERDRLDRELAKRDCDNFALRAANAKLASALQDVMQFCVTVKGMPDRDKGRTVEQQAAVDNARAALQSAGKVE